MKFNLIQYSILLIVVFVTAFVITPVFRSIARKLKILDYPGGRKLQANPVAYLGGLAIITPITLGSFLILFTSLSIDLKQQLYLGLILPALAIAFIGLIDDVYQLPPWPRFLSQSAVGLITSFMLYLSGAGVEIFGNQLLNSLATIFWVVAIINALNFIDNMDGLATSISIVASLGMFVLAYLNNQYLVAALSLAIFASCLGFLFWNKRPASIYLGDAGALYLGFLLAAISIRIDLDNDSAPIRALVLILILAIPVIDTTQVVVSRIIKGKSPFQGGRDHISHLLLNRGLSQRVVLFILTTFAVLFAGVAIILAEVI
ncbi:UDP-GlcNAc:undecaprenyl-phosphate GlcNAc-1-phosphate transferase [Candidatus Nanopelagicus abundans]|uniref:UDP-GlcNAc:undecaprenyl-phosphate GlcNAc-1-phosphate transferase n=1 Tax=Candidatus Nanopelagicus abundans TaxID=1884916 RepID=A0A249L5V7_9ACTN|nr:MraY family glycosyltransferase [Candidatus Nanopelagicus abundans]ASY24319.1 UDP-GlcNAc:undecaprenyl-phosphate GlcNAc-1-phosphate transferase [Candidatus Nanopelagicus abundans]